MTLLGTKILVLQVKMPLAPGVDPNIAAEEFMRRFQMPAAFINGAEIHLGAIDIVPQNGLRPGIVPGA